MAKIKYFYKWNNPVSYPGQLLWQYYDNSKIYFWDSYSSIQPLLMCNKEVSPYSFNDIFLMGKPQRNLGIGRWEKQMPQIKEFLKYLVEN